MRNWHSLFRSGRRIFLASTTTCCFFIGGGALTSYVIRTYTNQGTLINNQKTLPLLAVCTPKMQPQESVISETKNHSLFLTIYLDEKASARDCLKAVGHLQKYVDTISPIDLRDENDEILYGVGFGSEFLEKIQPNYQSKGVLPFKYQCRTGSLGTLPNTGGDIFVHAKCNEMGKLFELTQAIMQHMPRGSVTHFDDIYSWVYRNGRDLTGFIDGTENPADLDERASAAINSQTGGSYVLTQKWVHDFKTIETTQTNIKEGYVGRSLEDSTELRSKPITSHVSRMVGSADFDAPAKYQIVRQSQPYGTLSGDSGLLFIAYSSSPLKFDWMLDRMTGKDSDGHSDDIMRMTKCVTGNYWYFPSKPDLEHLVKG